MVSSEQTLAFSKKKAKSVIQSDSWNIFKEKKEYFLKKEMENVPSVTENCKQS